MKSHLRTLLLFFTVSLLTNLSFGQDPATPIAIDPDYTKEQTPTSPEAASLGNYGDVSNNPYNGKANVTINLHTLNFDGLSIPIALNYDTGGIKVDAESSWVGLNWSLSGTASITQRIYGNDDLNEGVIVNDVGDISSRVFSNIEIQETDGDASLDYADVKQIHSYQGTFTAPHLSPDLSADIFEVSVFGESYSFYLKRRVWPETIIEGHVFNDKYATIYYDLENQSFELKDSRGYTYFFNTKNYTATASSTRSSIGGESASSDVKEFTLDGLLDDYNHTDNTVISAWNLNRIDSPNNNSLYFNYQEGAYFTPPQYASNFKFIQESDLKIGDHTHETIVDNTPVRFTSSMSIIHAQYLSSISGDFGSIQFQSSSDRRDLLAGNDLSTAFPNRFGDPFVYLTKTDVVNTLRETNGNTSSTGYNLLARRLNQITISDPNDQVVKTVNLSHDYYNNHKLGNPDEALYVRLRLDGVQINEKEYSFNYSGSNLLPNKTTFDEDFWGYYNGANNDNSVPSVGRFMVGLEPELSFPDTPPNKLLPTNSSTTDDIPYGPEDLFVHGAFGEFYYEYQAADLSSDFNFGNLGNLSQITYPTGGSTSFEYEPHEVLIEATLPYVVEEYFSGTQNRRWTSLRNEDNYNFTYLYLKYAKDPDFSLLNHRFDPTIDEEGGVPLPGGVFTVDHLSAVKAEGLLDMFYSNDDQDAAVIEAIRDTPKYFLENVHQPEIIYPIMTFGDWYDTTPGQSPPDFFQKVIVIPPGSYRFKDALTPIGAPAVSLLSVVSGEGIGDFFLFEGTIDDTDGYAEIFEVGGARIKSISNYDNNGSFINKKEYAYNFSSSDFIIDTETAIPSGTLMDDLLYHSKLGFYSYIPYVLNYSDHQNTNFSSNNFLGQSGSAQGSHIGYSEVTEYSLDSDNNVLGAIKRSFNNKPNDYYKESASRMCSYDLESSQNHIITQNMLTPWENSIILGLPLKSSFDYSNGNVLQEEWYSCSGTITRTLTNTYNDLAIRPSDIYNAALWNFPVNGSGNYYDHSVLFSDYHWIPQHQTYFTYDMPNYLSKESTLVSTISTDFTDDGPLPNNVTYYDYDSQGNLISNYVEDSNGSEQGVEYYYPYSSEVFSNYGSPLLRSNQIYSQVVKAENYAGNNLLSQSAINFVSNSNTSGLPKANKALQSKAYNTLEERKSYERYNTKGKLVQSKQFDGVTVSYLWGYNDQYVVASVTNASYDELLPYKSQIDLLSSQDDDTCGYGSSCSESNLRDTLNALRASLPNAQVTSYTYNPLVGITSTTLPNGIVSYYSYDTFGRLIEIRDQNGNLLSSNTYSINNELINTLGSNALGIENCNEEYAGATTQPNDPDNSGEGNGDITIIIDPFNSSNPEDPNTRSQRNQVIEKANTKIVEDGIINDSFKFAPLNVDVDLMDTSGNNTSSITYDYKAEPYGGSGNVEYRWKVRGKEFSNYSSSNTWTYTFNCNEEGVRGLQVICEIRDKTLGITYRDEIRHVVFCNN